MILWILGCNWNISDNVFIGNFISDEILIKDHFWFKDYEKCVMYSTTNVCFEKWRSLNFFAESRKKVILLCLKENIRLIRSKMLSVY